jgi:hypothetical protein
MKAFATARGVGGVVVVMLSLGLAISPQVLGRGIYKWVDQQGRTHYADKPTTHETVASLTAEQLPQLNIQQAVVIDKRSPARLQRQLVRRTARRPSARTADCSKYRVQIRNIEKQLRQGYSEPSGARLHRRKREWSELIYGQCY